MTLLDDDRDLVRMLRRLCTSQTAIMHFTNVAKAVRAYPTPPPFPTFSGVLTAPPLPC